MRNQIVDFIHEEVVYLGLHVDQDRIIALEKVQRNYKQQNGTLTVH